MVEFGLRLRTKWVDFKIEELHMPCWVVPTLAADYWNVPLQEVLDCIQSGVVRTLQFGYFSFVDVVPVDEACTPHGARRGLLPTFVPLSDAENRALIAQLPSPTDSDADLAVEEIEGEDLETMQIAQPHDTDEEAPPLGSQAWQASRQKAGRLRRPPMAA